LSGKEASPFGLPYLNMFGLWGDVFVIILCFMAIRSLYFDVAAVKLGGMMKLSVENANKAA